MPPANSTNVGTRSIDSTSALLTVPRVDVGFRARIDDDQRNAGGGFVEELLFAEPVIAEIVAVIARENDHRRIEQTHVHSR